MPSMKRLLCTMLLKHTANSTESDIIVLGDFNADCSYASTYELNHLRFEAQTISGLYPIQRTQPSQKTHTAPTIALFSPATLRTGSLDAGVSIET